MYPDNLYEGPMDAVVGRLARELHAVDPIDTGEWQSMNVAGSKAHMTRELEDVQIVSHIPRAVRAWQMDAKPDLPWAENHFLERVSGMPLNPPPSHVDWPHAVRGNADHIEGTQFDHTYPERFWPVMANAGGTCADSRRVSAVPHVGIRFKYGDLGSVVQLLARYPGTRQAYLPVWFPEDTGGHNRNEKRVPCTLGYHFMIRYGIMSMRYYLRSCDLRRHFRNDVYMAGRLLQWVSEQVTVQGGPATIPGTLRMYVSSMHSFVADEPVLRGMMGG